MKWISLKDREPRFFEDNHVTFTDGNTVWTSTCIWVSATHWLEFEFPPLPKKVTCPHLNIKAYSGIKCCGICGQILDEDVLDKPKEPKKEECKHDCKAGSFSTFINEDGYLVLSFAFLLGTPITQIVDYCPICGWKCPKPYISPKCTFDRKEKPRDPDLEYILSTVDNWKNNEAEAIDILLSIIEFLRAKYG